MIRVSKVKYLHDYTLQVVFSDGSVKTVDLGDLVRKGGYYFAPLKDKDTFKNVTLDDMKYTICWPNGADLSPDTLYEMGVKVNKVNQNLATKRSKIRSSRPRGAISVKSKH